jgi:hypothetical protein
VGYAIKRLDGTYRIWNRNGQDDALRAGEVWEELAAAPAITADPLSQNEADASALREATTKATKVTVVWALKRILGRNPTVQEIQDARDEWIAVWKALG